MRAEKILKEAVLCFLQRGEEISLAVKTRFIGEGCRNGYGGGRKPGETEKEAVVREVKKETGGVIILPERLEKIAIFVGRNMKTDHSFFDCHVHVFLTRSWEGRSEPIATEEMADPRWFHIKELPLKEMMPADPYWVNLALSGKKILIWAKYGPYQKKLLAPVRIQFIKTFSDK
jgi:8-oxo-dGTP pyrophosphatase MutT (NUDIX family)